MHAECKKLSTSKLPSQLTTAVYDKPLKDAEAEGLIKDVIRLNDEL